MKSMLRLELKKALKNPFFFISVSVMTLFAALSAAYMVENNGEFNPGFLENYFLQDGEFYTNPMLSLTGFYNSWIGGESMSLVYSLFYTLLPVAAALPFAWSFFSERRSGYIKNVCTRTKKQYYFIAKGVAVFVSGALVALLPLAVNLLITSALLPVYQPEINYEVYTHVNFGDIWADIYYTQPLLFTLLYVLLTAVFCGVFALLSLAVTFFLNNRFAVLFLPFLLFLVLLYVENTIANSTAAWYVEIVPISFLHPTAPLLLTLGWVIFAELAFFLALSVSVLLIRGTRDEIL